MLLTSESWSAEQVLVYPTRCFNQNNKNSIKTNTQKKTYYIICKEETKT